MKKGTLREPRTSFRKITDSRCVKVLPDGSMVLGLDWVWGHEITPPNGILDMQERDCDEVFNPNKIKMMIDHVSPAKDTDSAMQEQCVRDWSRNHDVEFFDVGRSGICHRLIPESGLILPGQVGIMPDSHTCTHGAFCAFTAGVGTTEWEVGVQTGLWVCPPQKVVRVNYVGNLPANVFSKDLILSLIGKVGTDGFKNCVVEFSGPVIGELSMGARLTMTNMVIEAGGTCGMMMVDKKTVDYLLPILSKKSCYFGLSQSEIVEHMAAEFNSDTDSVYDQTITIDVSDMVPVAAVNKSPGDIVKVEEIAGSRIDQVLIGTCTNGGPEDLRIAARLIEIHGGKIANNLRCIVIPATQETYLQLLKEGHIETFLRAGCSVNSPSCGACLGMSCGVIAPGEVCVSTSNRNFPGRMGKGGQVILVSPATAAMTAITGYVRSPEIIECIDVIRTDDVREIVKPTGWKDRFFEDPNYAQLLERIGGGKPKSFGGRAFYLDRTDPATGKRIEFDTDQIIPAGCLNKIGKPALAEFCLTGLKEPLTPEGRAILFQSKVLVTSPNFGCGSSREHAPWALEGAGITCVIAESFARIFYNNMFANGILCVKLPKEVIEQIWGYLDEVVEVDWANGLIIVGEGIHKFQFAITEHERNLVASGGLVPVMLKMAAELQKEGKI